jgi:hypothetical protein
MENERTMNIGIRTLLAGVLTRSLLRRLENHSIIIPNPSFVLKSQSQFCIYK